MEVIRDLAEFRRWRDAFPGPAAGLGFVPTMGCLHAGHLALVRAAAARHPAVAVSIFVNPTQFGPREDYARYPRQLDEDVRLCREAGVGVVLAPDTAAMYPPGHATTVEPGPLGEVLEGACRPGHFRGVATVVAKLFNLVRPGAAYFGEKDAQQLAVVRRLARDLDIPVEVVGCPTVRELDGLALSSRNRRLTPDQRRAAPALFAALQAVRDMVRSGAALVAAEAAAVRGLQAAGFEPVDYVAVVDAATFQPPAAAGNRLVCAAATLGATRLIDNLDLDR